MMVANSGGWRNFATTKPIKTPEDVKGMKIRTGFLQKYSRWFKQTRRLTNIIAWPEVYTALSTGVEGTKNGIIDIIPKSIPWKLDYLTLDGHAYMGGAWLNVRYEV